MPSRQVIDFLQQEAEKDSVSDQTYCFQIKLKGPQHSSVMDHLKTHLKEAHKTNHTCSLCPFETSDTVEFFKHTYHHLGPYVGRSKVKLPQWGTWFSGEPKFDQKINSTKSIVNPVSAQYKSRNKKKHICADCGKLCWIENHSCYIKKLPPKPCEHCGKIFYRFDSLKNHVEQVWQLTQFFFCFLLYKIIYLPGGQINDPSSGKYYFSFVPPSNSLVSVSDP